MFNFLKRKRRVIDTEKIPVQEVACLNCGSTKFYEGPSGGMATNLKCAGCGLWWNDTPFGLDFIGIKENIDEQKKIVWYCPKCETVLDAGIIDRKYPHCVVCNTPLKVCWSYEDFPKKYCNICDTRFKCYTTRGNFE